VLRGGRYPLRVRPLGESLAQSQPASTCWPPRWAPPTLVDRTLARLTREAIARHQPALVLISVPFPGSVYGAFRIAQTIKAKHPEIVTVLGGGFVNTELRELAEPRVFDYFDYVTLDDGERPLLALLDKHFGARPVAPPTAARGQCRRPGQHLPPGR
jgi:hypothetical protein